MASSTRWTWVWWTVAVGDGQGGLECCDSWQIDGEKVETVRDFILGAPKSLQMMTAAMILKDAFSLEEKL